MKKTPLNARGYAELLPLITNVNSYIQNSLGIFTPALIALNGAFLFLFIEKNMFKDIVVHTCIIFFITSIFLYIASITCIFSCRIGLLNSVRTQHVNFEKMCNSVETKITFYIGLMFGSTLVSFIIFSTQLIYFMIL